MPAGNLKGRMNLSPVTNLLALGIFRTPVGSYQGSASSRQPGPPITKHGGLAGRGLLNAS